MSKPVRIKIVLIVRQEGRHGFDVVGPFDTEQEATEWIAAKDAEGFATPFIPPEVWTPKGSDFDDEPLDLPG